MRSTTLTRSQSRIVLGLAVLVGLLSVAVALVTVELPGASRIRQTGEAGDAELALPSEPVVDAPIPSETATTAPADAPTDAAPAEDPQPEVPAGEDEVDLVRVEVSNIYVTRTFQGCSPLMDVQAAVLLRGPFFEDFPTTDTLSPAKGIVQLSSAQSVEIPADDFTDLRVFADVVIDGTLFSHQATYDSTESVIEHQVVGDCRRTISYSVTVTEL